jgi:nucleoside-diphosphate-sugar epimerase
VYGDVQNRGVVNELFLSAFTGKPFISYGDPQKKARDYLFIDDAVSFLTCFITAPCAPQKTS